MFKRKKLHQIKKLKFQPVSYYLSNKSVLIKLMKDRCEQLLTHIYFLIEFCIIVLLTCVGKCGNSIPCQNSEFVSIILCHTKYIFTKLIIAKVRVVYITRTNEIYQLV